MHKTTHTLQTLSNGVRVLLIPMSGVASVATSVMVGVGSRYETKEINGISHFLEHMVFKGTQKYPTTDDVNTIERQGGLQNAYTDIDITNYHNKVLSSDWKLGLEINKELALFPRLEEQYVDRERDVILEEMKRYDDEPSAKVEEALHTKMYKGTKLGMRIIGEQASLHNVHSQELRDYHTQWYTPDKMVVVLAGDLAGKEAEIDASISEWFAKLPQTNAKVEDIEKVSEAQTEPQLVTVTKPDAAQAHLELGLRTFARGSTERYAWGVFNLLMGVSFTSRLFREIREKRGLCYHIRSSSTNWADVGNWTIYAGVATDKVEETVRETMRELAKVKSEGVSEDEVNVAKKRLATMVAFRAEDPEFQNEYYGRQVVFGDPVITLDEYLQKISEVTPEQINAVVRKYFVANNLNLAVVWNKPEDMKLRELLSY